jgi:hypothetical protein
MLPVELNLQTSRVTGQDALSVEEYIDLMMDRIDGILEDRLKALREMEKEKIKAAKAYNKRVKEKSFQVEELVWKTILLVGTRSGKFSKWCHTPFREIGNEASIRVPRMFKSHAWQQYDKQMQCY